MSKPSKEAMDAARDLLLNQLPFGGRAEDVVAVALDAFAARAIEQEREACASVCEAFADTAKTFLEKYPEDGHHMNQSAGLTIAATIRARGGK